jgi:hypothetical protein
MLFISMINFCEVSKPGGGNCARPTPPKRSSSSKVNDQYGHPEKVDHALNDCYLSIIELNCMRSLKFGSHEVNIITWIESVKSARSRIVEMKTG